MEDHHKIDINALNKLQHRSFGVLTLIKYYQQEVYCAEQAMTAQATQYCVKYS